MFDLSEIPLHQRTKEASLFHSLKLEATIKVCVPDELKKKVDVALKELFAEAHEEVGEERRFYRARINDFGQTTPIDKDKMGAPPKGLASLGRVQQACESVLYTAIKAETAIAEIRPCCGSHVSVAEFSTKPGCSLKVLNLAKYAPLKLDEGPESFFKQLSLLTKAMSFSEREFSRRVHPDDPNRYLDTIYITQLIREQGFDGIAYRSLLDEGGLNYAFFNQGHLTCTSVPNVFLIKSVQYELESII